MYDHLWFKLPSWLNCFYPSKAAKLMLYLPQPDSVRYSRVGAKKETIKIGEHASELPELEDLYPDTVAYKKREESLRELSFVRSSVNSYNGAIDNLKPENLPDFLVVTVGMSPSYSFAVYDPLEVYLDMPKKKHVLMDPINPSNYVSKILVSNLSGLNCWIAFEDYPYGITLIDVNRPGILPPKELEKFHLPHNPAGVFDIDYAENAVNNYNRRVDVYLEEVAKEREEETGVKIEKPKKIYFDRRREIKVQACEEAFMKEVSTDSLFSIKAKKDIPIFWYIPEIFTGKNPDMIKRIARYQIKGLNLEPKEVCILEKVRTGSTNSMLESMYFSSLASERFLKKLRARIFNEFEKKPSPVKKEFEKKEILRVFQVPSLCPEGIYACDYSDGETCSYHKPGECDYWEVLRKAVVSTSRRVGLDENSIWKSIRESSISIRPPDQLKKDLEDGMKEKIEFGEIPESYGEADIRSSELYTCPIPLALSKRRVYRRDRKSRIAGMIGDIVHLAQELYVKEFMDGKKSVEVKNVVSLGKEDAEIFGLEEEFQSFVQPYSTELKIGSTIDCLLECESFRQQIFKGPFSASSLFPLDYKNSPPSLFTTLSLYKNQIGSYAFAIWKITGKMPAYAVVRHNRDIIRRNLGKNVKLRVSPLGKEEIRSNIIVKDVLKGGMRLYHRQKVYEENESELVEGFAKLSKTKCKRCKGLNFCSRGINELLGKQILPES